MKIALTGANGMLATMLKQKIPPSCEVFELDLPDFDIVDSVRVSQALRRLRPDLIINCAAFTQVDLCESKPEDAFRVNARGAANLAAITYETGAVLVHVSTDFVFSGEQDSPYSEGDATDPLSVYGRSKREGELAIINSPLSQYYIVRTSWLYGPNGNNFVETIARLATEREELGIVADQLGSPTYTGDLADAIINLSGIGDRPPSPWGIYHFSNLGQCSWYEFACAVIDYLWKNTADIKVKKIKPIATEDYPVSARRPRYSVLSKEKYLRVVGAEVPEWQQSLKKYMDSRQATLTSNGN